MSPSNIQFSLVLALYNEGSKLQSNLERILHTTEHLHIPFEILLIDDGSKDATPEVARQFAEANEGVRFIQHEKNMGRGGTVMDGFQQSQGAVVGFMDVDCEISPVYILDFVPDLLQEKTDVITGLRIYRFSLSRVIRPFLSVSYRIMMRGLLRVKLEDTETGYKFFRKMAIDKLAPYVKHTGWFWDTEIMALASYAGLRIEERPVLFMRDREKHSTVRIFKDSLDYFVHLMRFRGSVKSIKKALAQKTS